MNEATNTREMSGDPSQDGREVGETSTRPDRNGSSNRAKDNEDPDAGDAGGGDDPEPYDDPAPTVVGGPEIGRSSPEPSPLCDLTGFGRDCLIAIGRSGGTSAPDVQDGLACYYPGEIHNGRLYPALAQLVDKGLVNKDEGKSPNEYTITRRGRRELEAHLLWVRDGIDFQQEGGDA